MKVLIFETEEEAKRNAASRLLRQVQLSPSSVLGLATGGTMEAVYAHLIQMSLDQSVSWSGVATFNLDEYWGVPADSPASYRTYMNAHLFDHIDIVRSATHVPASDGRDPRDAAQLYEDAISAAGGIDLQLLGIGKNGHIGFNEPTSSLSSTTRIKTLTDDTRRANRRYFDRLEDVPKYALTVGIGTILASKECLIVGTGQDKAAAVKAMIEGPVSAVCPASALQMHRNVTVVIDEQAARDLELIDYYQHVHPAGQEADLFDV
ncbi:glucosamine-6-phosphate deaminase [Aliiroseovarius sp. PrR006]|uniref:glucosamine-6-phosphate deaminase n=1 Tax=Aliiroseovarius sp. PrR006 TaxID=2706883 RepID=UPI0013D29791|nr:glucosamine-6-phosphate deaminase [Aliiroseovarius sp. PrR006]NDW54268.1 glucosamine-6-phosphate deaminase [Aliiroseovarius sp. PrR006]